MFIIFYYPSKMCALKKVFKFKNIKLLSFTWTHIYNLLYRNDANSHLYLVLSVWFLSQNQSIWIRGMYWLP